MPYTVPEGIFYKRHVIFTLSIFYFGHVTHTVPVYGGIFYLRHVILPAGILLEACYFIWRNLLLTHEFLPAGIFYFRHVILSGGIIYLRVNSYLQESFIWNMLSYIEESLLKACMLSYLQKSFLKVYCLTWRNLRLEHVHGHHVDQHYLKK
jgi:hypothetical protein